MDVASRWVFGDMFGLLPPPNHTSPAEPVSRLQLLANLATFGLLVMAIGALAVVRVAGVGTALVWVEAVGVCLVAGLISLLAASKWLVADQVRATKILLAMPAGRIAAVVFLGWLASGLIAEVDQTNFWLSLVIAYMVLLLAETLMLINFVRGLGTTSTAVVER